MSLDLAIFNSIHKFWGVNRFLDFLGVFLANFLTYLMVVGMAIFVLYIAHTTRERLFVVTEMLAAFVLSRWLIAANISLLMNRARPFRALDFIPPFVPLTNGSFPSGHMSALFSLSFVMMSFSPVWGVIYLVLSLLVGLGRIFVGVHWPSDILAGILIGIFSGWLVCKLFFGEREKVFDFLKLTKVG